MSNRSGKEIYVIRIAGHLDDQRVRHFHGMTASYLPDGSTELVGPIRDQAELHGLLSRIRDLGVVLILVRRQDETI